MAPKKSTQKKKRNGGKGKQSKPALSTTSTSTDPAVPTPINSDSNTSTSQEQSSHLVRLPLKLREKIYAYLLDARHVRGPSTFAYTPQAKGGKLRLIPSSKPFHFSLAILRSNKQIHRESLHVFHRTNLFIRLSLYNDDIYWTEALLEGSQLGFVTSNHARLSTLTTHSLDVNIIMEDSPHLRCQVVFPAVYLPRFIDLLETMCTALPQWSREHSIHLFLRHRYRSGPLADETLLLEPWRALHGMHQVIVGTDVVSPSFAQSLRASMMGSKWDPWTWLASVQRQKEMGAEEMRRGIFADKAEYFTNTIALLEKLYRGPQYPLLEAAGDEFDKAVNRLRLQCELNIILAATKSITTSTQTMVDMDQAWQAIDRALDLVLVTAGAWGLWGWTKPQMPRNQRSWYTNADVAKVRYRRGCFYMEVGLDRGDAIEEILTMAREELDAAREANPGDERIEKAMRDMEARRKIAIEMDLWEDA